MPFKPARSITTGAILLLLLCSCATQAPVGHGIPSETVFKPVAGHDQRIYLTLHLESGRELLFIVDTGAPVTLLDKSLEPDLGKCTGTYRSNYDALGIVTEVKVFHPPKLFLGGIQLLTGDQVYTDDVQSLPTGRPVMGILGMDCLRHYCIQLDLPAGKLRFLDPAHSGIGITGEKYPISWVNGVPWIHANLFGDSKEAYMVDTGCPDDVDLKAKRFAAEVRRLQSEPGGEAVVLKQIRLSPRVLKHL
ncbi:MAG: retropepsin-like aspartic protease, partial [Verrucomicrobiota bacterium]